MRGAAVRPRRGFRRRAGARNPGALCGTDDRAAHRLFRDAGHHVRPRSRPHRSTPSPSGGSRRPTRRRPNCTSPASRGGSNCSAGSISRPAAPRRWCACASSCIDAMDHVATISAVIDNDFVHLFSSWFNRGFLVLRRIDWSTSAVDPGKDHPLRGGPRDPGLGRSAPAHRSAGPPLLCLLSSGAGRRTADLRRGGADRAKSRQRSRRSCPTSANRSNRSARRRRCSIRSPIASAGSPASPSAIS